MPGRAGIVGMNLLRDAQRELASAQDQQAAGHLQFSPDTAPKNSLNSGSAQASHEVVDGPEHREEGPAHKEAEGEVPDQALNLNARCGVLLQHKIDHMPHFPVAASCDRHCRRRAALVDAQALHLRCCCVGRVEVNTCLLELDASLVQSLVHLVSRGALHDQVVDIHRVQGRPLRRQVGRGPEINCAATRTARHCAVQDALVHLLHDVQAPRPAHRHHRHLRVDLVARSQSRAVQRGEAELAGGEAGKTEEVSQPVRQHVLEEGVRHIEASKK